MKFKELLKKLSGVAKASFDNDLNGTAAVRAILKDMGVDAPVFFAYGRQPVVCNRPCFSVLLDEDGEVEVVWNNDTTSEMSNIVYSPIVLNA